MAVYYGTHVGGEGWDVGMDVGERHVEDQLQGESAANLLPPFGGGLPSPSKFFRLDQTSPITSSSSSSSPSSSSSSPASSFSSTSSSSSASNNPSKTTSYYNTGNNLSQDGLAQHTNPSYTGRDIRSSGGVSTEYQPDFTLSNQHANFFPQSYSNSNMYTPKNIGPISSHQHANVLPSSFTNSDMYTPKTIDPISKMNALTSKTMNDPDKLAAPFLTDASFIPGKASSNSKAPLPTRPRDVRNKNKATEDSSSLSQMFFKNMKGNPAAAVLPSGGFKQEFDASLLGGSNSFADVMVAGQGKSRDGDYEYPDFDDPEEQTIPNYGYDYDYGDDNRNGQYYKNDDDGDGRGNSYYGDYDYPTGSNHNYDYGYDYDNSEYGNKRGNSNDFSNYTDSSKDYKQPGNYDRETTKSYHVGKDEKDEFDNRFGDNSKNRNNDYHDPDEGDSTRPSYDDYDYSNPYDEYYPADDYYYDPDYKDRTVEENNVNDKRSSFNPSSTEYNPYDVSSPSTNQDNRRGRDERPPEYYSDGDDDYNLDQSDEEVGEGINTRYEEPGYIANEYGNNKNSGLDDYVNTAVLERYNSDLDSTSLNSNVELIPDKSFKDDGINFNNDRNYGIHSLAGSENFPTSTDDDNDSQELVGVVEQNKDKEMSRFEDNGANKDLSVIENNSNIKSVGEVSAVPRNPFIGPVVSKTNLFIEPVQDNPLIILPTTSSNQEISKTSKASGPQPFRRPQ